MNSLISNVMQYIPAEIDLLSSVKFIGIVAVGILVLGFLGRITMGKRSDLNHAVSSAVGILFIYGLTVVIYSFGVTLLERFLSPLPFVSISGDYLTLLDFRGSEITDICYHILSMVILAFLINLLDTLIPKGENVFIWYLLRFTTGLLSMVLHAIVSWALATYLPDVLVTYAPILLLAVLALMLLLGLLKLILGVALTAVNPILGAIYAFFFSHMIGKQVSKAVLTTLLLSVLVFVLNELGYTVICIASAVLTAYIPLVIVLLILWYLVGHLL